MRGAGSKTEPLTGQGSCLERSKGPKLHVPRRIAHVSLRDETHSAQNGKAPGLFNQRFGKQDFQPIWECALPRGG